MIYNIDIDIGASQSKNENMKSESQESYKSSSQTIFRLDYDPQEEINYIRIDDCIEDRLIILINKKRSEILSLLKDKEGFVLESKL